MRYCWLLAGKLKARPIPKETCRLLPPASVVKSVRPAVGTAIIPAECWAMIDSARNPVRIKETLSILGLSSIAMRRYALEKAPKNVIEVELYVFPNERSAEEWARRMLSDVSIHQILKAGKTGQLSGFTYRKSISLYELTFAKGRFVADISSWAHFDETSPLCENAVRELAEEWYASMPAE